MNTQPEALRLAELLSKHSIPNGANLQVAKELRRLHEENTALRQAIQKSTLQEISDIGQEAHTDHPARHWDRTCPACVKQTEQWDTSDMAHRSGGLSVEQALDGLAETSWEIEQTPDLLRQSEREGWRYAKECEAEIKRLKELAEYRLQLLMKMHGNELDAIERGYFAGKEAGVAECEAVKLREKNNG